MLGLGIQSISLKCDKPSYYAGEPITGYATVTVIGMINIPVIQMTFKGKAKVRWTEERSEQVKNEQGMIEMRPVKDVYSSKQELICVHRDMIVQGGLFLPGTYSLPFAIETPCNLISSFEGHHGSIRYCVKAKKMSGAKKAKTYVCIVQAIDTNLPSYQFPVAGVDDKTICCLCCASGPLTIDARCDRAAYSPGDTVVITAHFDNKSSRDVRPYLRLVQRQHYYAKGGQNDMQSSRYEEKQFDLAPLNGAIQMLPAGGASDWNQMAFQIPPCYPSGFCQIITISYCLQVCMDIPGAIDLRVSLPIVLGTVPYRAGVQVVTAQPTGGQVGWSGFGAQTGPQPVALPVPPIAAAESLASLALVAVAPPTFFLNVFEANAKLAMEADAMKP